MKPVNKKLILIFATTIFYPFVELKALQPASNIESTDHQGTDWTITVDTVIAGVHNNLGIFTIDAGVTVKVMPWNGVKFGSVEIHASTITVSGLLNADGSGYRGGSGGNGRYTPGNAGEGPGSSLGAGYYASGGGAGYGGNGGDYGGPVVGSLGGGTYGTSGLVTAPPSSDDALLGSGSGGAAGSPWDYGPTVGNAGRSGGGTILLFAKRIDVNTLSSNGVGGHEEQDLAATGGSSGGTILVDTNELYVYSGISCDGGMGGSGNPNMDGGSGGGGRIKLFYQSISGMNEHADGAPKNPGHNNAGSGANGTVHYNQKPTSPVLLSPLDGATTTFPLFDWTESIDDDGPDNDTSPGDGGFVTYELQVSSSLSFNTLYIATNPTSSIFQSTFSLNTNFPFYYWRVRAFDQQSYTDWTTPQTIAADNSNPTGQGIMSKVSYISSVTIIVNVATDTIGGLHTLPYYIDASSSPAFVWITTSSNWQASNIWSAAGLVPDTTYFFRTKARDAALNETPWTSTTSVKTLTTRPGSVALPLIGSTSIQVSWGAGINPAGTQFSVQMYSDPNFLVSVTSIALVTGITQTFSGLSPNATYFVRIANKDYVSYSYEFISVTVVTLPNPVLPAAFTNINTSALTANWGANGNPTGTEYLAEASSVNGGALAASSAWISALTHNFSGLSANVTYYVRVKSRNSALSEGSYASLGSTSTLAVSPPAPTAEGKYDAALPQEYFVQVTPDFGSNSAQTELAIESFDSAGFLQGNGTIGSGKVWKTKAQWLSGSNTNREIITGTPLNSYRYRVYARNFNGLETGFLLQGTGVLPTALLSIDRRDILDLNDDGLGDTIKLTFSQNLQDSTFVLSDLLIGGSAGSAILLGVSGDAADDTVIYITLPNPLPSDDVSAVRYKGSSLKAISGRGLAAESTGVASTDKVSPTLASLSAASLNGKAVIRARFSENMDANSFNNVSGWIFEAPVGSIVPLTSVTVSFDGAKTVSLTLPHELENASSAKITAKNVSDSAGNVRSTATLTTSTLLKSLQGFTVVKDAQGKKAQGGAVDASAKITLFFDREMDAASLQNNISLFMIQDKLGNSVFTPFPGTVQVLVGNQMVRFVPFIPLNKGSKFRVVLSSALTDAFGMSPGIENSWDFRTAADYTEKMVTSPKEGFRILVNPGTFSQDAGVSLLTDPLNNALYTDRTMISRAIELEKRKASQAGNSSHFPISDLTFEIVGETSEGGVIQGTLGNSVQVTVSYPDANNDGIVDNTNPGVAAKELEMYYLDETLGEFRKIASTVDTNNKTITASLNHFSIYSVMGKIASSVSGFIIRPNTWFANSDPRPMVFDNLPDDAEIDIYKAPGGERVKTLRGNGQTAVDYYGTDDSGGTLASGIYIAILKGSGGTKSLKFTIVK